jgi:hypothetical protein
MATIVSFDAKLNIGAVDGVAGLAALPPLATKADDCRRGVVSLAPARRESLVVGQAFSLTRRGEFVSGAFRS